MPRGALLPVEALPGDPGDPIEGPAAVAARDRPARRGARAWPATRSCSTTTTGSGVAVCGRGLPVVLVHGFTAEGILYAQTLSRLVGMGFKVVAVDVAGHGATQGLPTGGDDLESYTQLLARVLDELGIRRAVFAGHSMGGRLVTQLAARDPDRAIAVVLIDAVVGDCWDRLIKVSRFAPPVLIGLAALLVADTLSTLPWLRNPAQAAKLGRLIWPDARSATPPTRGACSARRSR